MLTAKEAIQELTNPRRRNELEARRRKLGLSRVALGRILGVDPAAVFRRERGPLIGLWDYAMRGIEAEAANKEAKQVIRRYKASLDQRPTIPDIFDAQGETYVAEKMRAAHRLEVRKKPAPRQPDKKPGEPRSTSRSEAIKQTADKYIPDPERRK